MPFHTALYQLWLACISSCLYIVTLLISMMRENKDSSISKITRHLTNNSKLGSKNLKGETGSFFDHSVMLWAWRPFWQSCIWRASYCTSGFCKVHTRKTTHAKRNCLAGFTTKNPPPPIRDGKMAATSDSPLNVPWLCFTCWPQF